MMKKLHLLFMFSFLIISCKNDKALDEYERLKMYEKQELATGVRHDTILLDYRIGMSKDDWQHHTDSLIAVGKLKLNEAGILIYNYGNVEGAGYTDLQLGFLFDNNSLWLCSCEFTNPNVSINKVYGTILKKGGKMVRFDFDDTEIIEHVYGNRKIKIREGIDGVDFAYFDITTQRKLIEQNKLNDSLLYLSTNKRLKEDF